jgi:hypothetical protein
MTDTLLRRARPAALLVALFALAGCADSDAGEVSGTVTVDGQTPAEGSSITFVPNGGKSSGGGSTIQNGKYAVKLPVGSYKVEIRVPRPLKAAKTAPAAGPGPGGPANIEESLPAKYNDKTDLTFEMKAGRNEKNWELTR